jgi:N-terminal domain of NWD NACHT-NTPase
MQVQQNQMRYLLNPSQDCKELTDLAAQPDSTRPQAEKQQGLWDRSWQDLLAEEPQLSKDFERVLAGNADKPAAVTSFKAIPFTEEFLHNLVQRKVERMQEREWKIRLGDYSINLRDQIDRLLSLVIVTKDFASQAARLDPVHTGLPLAGLCLIVR